MPTLKEFNNKLARLRSTRKLTRTMKMVAANKFRKAHDGYVSATAYQAEVERVMARVKPVSGGVAEGLESRRAEAGRALVLVLTSDRGLCGGFNTGVLKNLLRWMAENQTAKHRQVHVSCCGRRGYVYLRGRADVRKQYEGIMARPTYDAVVRISLELQAAFLSGRYDAVYVAHNEFRSALSQKPVVRQLLPVDGARWVGVKPEHETDVMVEPSRDAMWAELLRLMVHVDLYAAIMASAAGEHGARMNAMDQSTTNAENLIDRYALLRNRARQAAITRELNEIVSGAEALK